MALPGCNLGGIGSFKWGGELRFYDSDESHYSGFKAASTTTDAAVYTLPSALPVSSGYLLSSTTAGVLSWVPNGGTQANLSVGSGVAITAGSGTNATNVAVTLAVDQSFTPTWTGLHTFDHASGLTSKLVNVVAASGTASLILSDTLADSNSKEGTIVNRSWNNAEEHVMMMRGWGLSTNNLLLVGGGLATYNAATIIRFYTAASVNTLSGTQRLQIDATGDATFAGNILPGTADTYTVGSSSSRFASMWADSLDARLDFNGQATLLTISNLATDSGSSAMTAVILTKFARTSDATGRVASQLVTGKEAEWTSTASTNDAYWSVELAVNGSLTERLRLGSSGLLTIASATISGLTASQFVKTDSSKNLVSSSAVSLSSEVSGTLPIANGGTNSSSQSSGGLVYFNGTSMTSTAAAWFVGTDATFFNMGVQSPNTSYQIMLQARNTKSELVGSIGNTLDILTVEANTRIKISPSGSTLFETGHSSGNAIMGFFGATAVTKRTNVPDPSGGATQDAEARTAISAILTRLEEYGLFAT